MNYRHAFHAGNFADCMKHALLVSLLQALLRKPAPVFVLDTHAGAGMYDLESGPAQRTGEAAGGIRRLLEDVPAPLSAYIGLVGELGLERDDAALARCPGSPALVSDPDTPALIRYPGSATLTRYPGSPALIRYPGSPALIRYPGSPALIRAMLRPGDRLACCELHPEDATTLRRQFAHDPQVAVHGRDGWEALRGLLPPKEKRGLVLIDPPYENRLEFAHLVGGLRLANARFRTGVLAAWYPIKHRAPVRDFRDAVKGSGIRDIMAAELWLREPIDPGRLNGCGLLIVNPPYRFEEDAGSILSALSARLGEGERGQGWDLSRLTDE